MVLEPQNSCRYGVRQKIADLSKAVALQHDSRNVKSTLDCKLEWRVVMDEKLDLSLSQRLQKCGLSDDDAKCIAENPLLAKKVVAVMSQLCESIREILQTAVYRNEKKERPTSEEICEAIHQLRLSGAKVTQARVAAKIGYPTPFAFRQVLHRHPELRETYSKALKDPKKLAAP